jgi:hypothetical protein
MSDSMRDKQRVKCPECNADAQPDTAQMPPKFKDKNMEFHFICPNGHRFVRRFKGK